MHPYDLLRLARTTKAFRRLLLSRSSITIWRESLALVPDLPECPADLTEPAYTNLVFDPHCHVCSLYLSSAVRSCLGKPWYQLLGRGAKCSVVSERRSSHVWLFRRQIARRRKPCTMADRRSFLPPSVLRKGPRHDRDVDMSTTMLQALPQGQVRVPSYSVQPLIY